jgi:hypothetical protein
MKNNNASTIGVLAICTIALSFLTCILYATSTAYERKNKRLKEDNEYLVHLLIEGMKIDRQQDSIIKDFTWSPCRSKSLRKKRNNK